MTRSVPALSVADADHGVLARLRTVHDADPDAVVVASRALGSALTYRALVAEAAAVLGTVRAAAAPAGAPVALLQPHAPSAVSALLGVIASGHPVVVLDPRTPPARLRMFVERSGAALVLAHAKTMDAAAQLGVPVHQAAAAQLGVPVHRSDGGTASAGGASAEEVAAFWASPVDVEAPAALAFTSGSTGVPKVVVNNQLMLVRDAWTNSVDTGCYGADDVVAHTLPLAFHAGLMVTVAGLVVGSRMELYDVRGEGIAGLPRWLAEVGAGVMHSSPAILRAFVGSRPDPSLLVGLRSLTIAGEAAHGRDVEAARALLPAGCVVRNRYGSSETGLIAEYAVPAGHPVLSGPLPVGRPVGDTVLRITDADGAELADGEVGVLTVTTRYLASGYWSADGGIDPELSAASFTTNPDGTGRARTARVSRGR